MEKELASVEEVYYEDGIFKFKITEEMLQNKEENFLIKIFKKMEEANRKNNISTMAMESLLGDLCYYSNENILWDMLYRNQMMPGIELNEDHYYELVDAYDTPCLGILFDYAITHGQSPKEFIEIFDKLRRENDEACMKWRQEEAEKELEKWKNTPRNTSTNNVKEDNINEDEGAVEDSEELNNLLSMMYTPDDDIIERFTEEETTHHTK